MSRRLVLVRHGQTAWNLQRRGQGHTDIPLDEVGIAQARAAAPWLAAFQPSVVWSSDLARARVTAEHAAAQRGLTVRLDARLREFDLGERAGLTVADYRARHPDEYERFRHGDFRDVPGAEQVPEVAKRMVDVLGEIAGELPSAATALVFSHGSAIRAGVLAMIGQPVALQALAGLPNCGAAVLEEAPGAPAGWCLTAYGLQGPDPDFASGGGGG